MYERRSLPRGGPNSVLPLLAAALCSCGGSERPATPGDTPSSVDGPTAQSSASLTGGTGDNGALLAWGGQMQLVAGRGQAYCLTVPNDNFAEGQVLDVEACSEPMPDTQAMLQLAGVGHPGFNSQQELITSADTGAWAIAADTKCQTIGLRQTCSATPVFLTHSAAPGSGWTNRQLVWNVRSNGIQAVASGTIGGWCWQLTGASLPAPSIGLVACDRNAIGQMWMGAHWHTAFVFDGAKDPSGSPYYLSWAGSQFVAPGLSPFVATGSPPDANGFWAPGSTETWQNFTNYYQVNSGNIYTNSVSLSPAGYGTSIWLNPDATNAPVYQSSNDVTNAWQALPAGTLSNQTVVDGSGVFSCLTLPSIQGQQPKMQHCGTPEPAAQLGHWIYE